MPSVNPSEEAPLAKGYDMQAPQIGNHSDTGIAISQLSTFMLLTFRTNENLAPVTSPEFTCHMGTNQP